MLYRLRTGLLHAIVLLHLLLPWMLALLLLAGMVAHLHAQLLQLHVCDTLGTCTKHSKAAQHSSAQRSRRQGGRCWLAQ
jgi:hypothetical protein